MKLFVGALALLVLQPAVGVDMADIRLQCEAIMPLLPTASRTSEGWKRCMNEVRELIMMQMDMAHDYLLMGGWFLRDVVNRAGLGGYFMQLATHKRQLTKNLIDYLLMRGQLDDDEDLFLTPSSKKHEWVSGQYALTDALTRETDISDKFLRITRVCGEDAMDVVSHLVHEFLPEQHELQHELTSKLHTLKSMLYKSSGALGNLMFDQTL